MKFFIINILWTLTNLPILFIGISIIYSQSITMMFIKAVPLALLLPILFFPSTMAVFANVREWILEIEQSSIVKAYWSHFKKNYRRGFWSGITLTLIWTVWGADFYYFISQSMQVLALVLFLVGLLLFVFTMNFLNVTVHYKMTTKELFTNAFNVTFGRPKLFLFILMGNGLLLYISMKKFLFLFPFFYVSISAFLTFYAFYRFTLKIKGTTSMISEKGHHL